MKTKNKSSLKTYRIIQNTAQKIDNYLSDKLSELPITLKQFEILLYVYEYKDNRIKVGDIAIAYEFNFATITYIMGLLEKKGYLNREFSKEDRRCVYISMTKKGNKLIENHYDQYIENVSKFFKELKVTDLTTLNKILKT